MSRIDIEGFFSLEHQNFDILAIPHGKPFIVKSEKTEEFKSVKPNHKVRERNGRNG